MGVSAPWSGVRGALSPAMSVFTHPGQQAFISTSSLPAQHRQWEIFTINSWRSKINRP